MSRSDKIRRWATVVWIAVLFGVLSFNLSIPWMREFLLGVFTSLHKHPMAFAEALLITFFADVGMVHLAKYRPRPYAWSLVTLFHYVKRLVRAAWRREPLREVRITEAEEFEKNHFNFAAMRVKWLWVPFLVLLILNVPVLAAFEEIIFRNGKAGIPTIVLWSFLFAVVHFVAGYRVVSVPFIFIIGLWLGAHYVNGGLHEAVIHHVAMNLIGMFVMLWDMKIWPDLRPHVADRAWYQNVSRRLVADIGGSQ